MTSDQIALVQESFAIVLPIKEAAARLFYGRVFETAPQARALFKNDMDEQGRKLMATLAVVVAGLRDLDAVVPVAQRLAVQHVAYGVRPEHYPVVGAALIWTLEQGLGAGFTPAVRAAWTQAYATLSSVMIAAAYPEGAAS